MAASARKDWLSILLLVLVVVMGAEIVYLVGQNRRLEFALDSIPSHQVLQQGQAFPPLAATDLDGADVAVHYGAGEPSTVLIWLSPTCHICGDNVAFWNDLYARFQGSSRLRFLVLSDTGPADTRTYVDEHGLALPVACVTDDAMIDAYNGRVVPQTAFILPDGTIARVWPGALEEARQNEISTLLRSFTTSLNTVSEGGDRL